MGSKKTISPYRNIYSLPDIYEFYYLLYDRLHMTLDRYEDLKEPFSIIITAFSRVKDKKVLRKELKKEEFAYIGLKRQKELLKANEPYIEELQSYWKYLEKTTSSPRGVTATLFGETEQMDLSLNDIITQSTGPFTQYFKTIFEKGEKFEENQNKVAEYHVLKYCFELEKYHYLSVPLIQFGEIDGVVHIVYHEKDYSRLFEQVAGEKQLTEKVKNIIKCFSIEYEGIILDWAIVGDNKFRKSTLEDILNPDFFKRENTNPIILELEYQKYYEKHESYFRKRLAQNAEIPGILYETYLRTAIITILIDSYAHNISAHSLTALNWWFKQRREKFKKFRIKDIAQRTQKIEQLLKAGQIESPSRDNDKLKDLLEPILYPNLDKGEEEDAFIYYNQPLDKELQPLLNFLLEKGAFWSGVTRDHSFGGEVNNLFDTLWTDFINNPLYLGTIAKTEGITKINLKIVHYHPKQEDTYRYPINKKEVDLAGTLAVIDINKNRPEDQYSKDKKRRFVPLEKERLYHDEHNELEDRSDFVQPGEEYVELKKQLKKCRVFFPGGVVGRHALYTMIENEIRNVKHYKGKALKEVQQNGLTVVFSIREAYLYNRRDGKQPLYKIGIWLDIPTTLRQDQGTDENPYLIKKKYDSLLDDIMDEDNFAPSLGGNFQDKICAAMLFNNTFSSVQRGNRKTNRLGQKDSERDKQYYPWIIPTTATKDHPHHDFELSKRTDNNRFFETDDYEQGSKTGYLKKQFFLWKGAKVKDASGLNDKDFDMENLSRFRFVNVENEEQKDIVRRAGIIRILENEEIIHGRLDIAYQSWLPKWLGNESRIIRLEEYSIDNQDNENQLLKNLIFDGKTGKTLFQEQLSLEPKADESKTRTIFLGHGGKSEQKKATRYRNHGVYKTYFSPDDKVFNEEENATRAAELLEILETQICIFDNRVRHRIKKEKRDDYFWDTLKLLVRNERTPGVEVLDEKDESEPDTWLEAKGKYIPNCHFLVVHLTYIERILKANYSDSLSEEERKSMEESKLGFFFEREIMPLVMDKGGSIRDNFALIVTTGRGRTKWWENLVKSEHYQQYQNKILFRPVESIISGIENAISKKDDIELKANLVKLFFGS